MAPADEKKQHKCDLPCSQHITIFLWICGLFVTIFTVLTTNVIANDRRAMREEKELYSTISNLKDQKENEHARIIAETAALSKEVLQRLARIEAKIEAKGITCAN